MSTQDKLKELIKTGLIELLSEASGIDLSGVDENTEFLDIGLDSLVLAGFSKS